jgi:hypothetical protein
MRHSHKEQCTLLIRAWGNHIQNDAPLLRPKAKKKYMCVYCHMSKKSRVGRSGLIFFYFFFLLSAKPEIVFPESDSGISFSNFPVKWRIMQFFYLLCSQFWQKPSSWINKTLLLVKQQKFIGSLAKIRVGRVTVNTHIFFFWPYTIVLPF